MRKLSIPTLGTTGKGLRTFLFIGCITLLYLVWSSAESRNYTEVLEDLLATEENPQVYREQAAKIDLTENDVLLLNQFMEEHKGELFGSPRNQRVTLFYAEMLYRATKEPQYRQLALLAKYVIHGVYPQEEAEVRGYTSDFYLTVLKELETAEGTSTLMEMLQEDSCKMLTAAEIESLKRGQYDLGEDVPKNLETFIGGVSSCHG